MNVATTPEKKHHSGAEQLTAAINLHGAKRYEDAILVLDSAIRQLQEELRCALVNKASALAEIGRGVEALAILDNVLRYTNDYNARWSRGLVLMQLDRWGEAIADFDQVIGRGTDLDDLCRFSRGFANLVRGRLREGFVDFEHRKKHTVVPANRPEWDGRSSLAGKTILVVGESGRGDNIMFARYAPMLAGLGAEVIMAVPPEMQTLMDCVEGITAVSSGHPRFDVWVRMMSLAHKFGTDIDTVPPPVKFRIPPILVDGWCHLMRKGRLNVGLCWSGNKDSFYDRHRNVPLAQLAPLLDIPGVDFYSLTMDLRDSDKPAFDRCDVYDTGSKIKNFRDTACLISGLDLVITVDTSVAHLAGSLGIPTWVMLTSFRTYWGFHIAGRSDCPWYPSVMTFRQSKIGDWSVVVSRIGDQLKQVAEGTLNRVQ